MIRATCQCGAVSVSVPAVPDFINDCNCDLCRKSGGAWGYYAEADVAVSGSTQAYGRADTADPNLFIHFCPTCGATTHWLLSESYKARNPGRDRAGVNMRLFGSGDLDRVELRFPDGKAWNGTGPYGYRRQAFALGSDAAF